MSDVQIGGSGDPRMISPLASETPIYGTETPYRRTPPTNFSSIAETAATGTPPTAAGVSHASAVAAPTSVCTALPAVTGTTTVGQTLTCSSGTWSPAASTYAYQWFRNDVAISGATATTRVLAAADLGTRLTCRVIATHATLGPTMPVSSNPTAVIA